MTIYMTNNWGFGTPSGPLQFSQRGWRDSARAMLQPDDLVVIVGTMGEETLPGECAMILGLMEPATTIVSSLDYDLARAPSDFDEFVIRSVQRFQVMRAGFDDGIATSIDEVAWDVVAGFPTEFDDLRGGWHADWVT